MTGAIALPDPDDPEQPPLETEGVGEDPGTIPEVDEAAVEPVDPRAPEPDVNDGEAATPIGDSTAELNAPEQTDADDERPAKPFDGDTAFGRYGQTAE